MGMWRAIIRPFLLIVGTMVASGCSHLAYQPSRFHYGYPERAKIHYEKVDFKSRDGTALTGWFFPAVKRNSRGPIPTVIQFHGNAENMTSHFFSLYWLIEAGYNVFTFDYRGYGRSEGSPDQAGVNLDVLAAIDYVRGRIPASNSCRDLILYGQSLGGAALARGLADLEDRSRISAVILEGSFYSYRKIAQDILRRVWLTYLFQHLAYVLVSNDFSPETSFVKISPLPLLVIHGEKDPVIPVQFGRRIFELAKEPKELWLIPNGQHLDTMFREKGKYRDRLVDWLEQHRLR